MDDESNLGVNKLAQVMQQRMSRNQDAAGGLVLDFGTIQKDMSLKTNTFSIPIPQTDYHVTRQLTIGATGNVLTKTATDGKHDHGSSGSHSHSGGSHDGHVSGSGDHAHSGDGEHVHNGEGPHVHNVLIPEKMRSIKPGDRVLVAWVQSEAVVIDIILPATSV